MPEWVTRSPTILERQTIHSLDMRKPLVWCSVACFLLMLTSIDFLFAFFFFVEQKNCIVLLIVNVAGVNQFFLVLLPDFPSYEMHLRRFNSMILHQRWHYAGKQCIFRFRHLARGNNLHFLCIWYHLSVLSCSSSLKLLFQLE